MSHIATALAKSKGKNVSAPAAAGAPGTVGGLSAIRIGPQATPVLTRPPMPVPSAAPFPAAASAPATEMPVSKPAAAAPGRSTLVVVVTAIVLVAGASAWLLLKTDSPFAHLTKRPPAVTPAPATPSAKMAPIETASERKPPSAELIEKVRSLPITAAAGGSSQRLSMGGKVYEPGQTIAEGLILQAIETEEIVFRDVDGNIYTRKL